MKVLGLGNPFLRHAAAALVVDGELVAAVEEERLTRSERASPQLPLHAARYCLAEAGLDIEDVDRIAIPWSRETQRRDLTAFVRRMWRRQPLRALEAMRLARRHKPTLEAFVHQLTQALARPRSVGQSLAIPIAWVDSPIAQAAGAYHLSGWSHSAIICLGHAHQLVSTFLAEGRYGDIVPVQRIASPDSLDLFFSAVTEYLGFHSEPDLTMELATYGRPGGAGVSALIERRDTHRPSFRVHDALLNGREPWGIDAPHIPPVVLASLGTPANGDVFSERYCDIAATAQHTLEQVVISFLDTALRPALEFGRGRVCLTGTCALNPRLNQRVLEHPLVHELWVPPAADESGTAVGAALWATHHGGGSIRPLRHPYLGPAYLDAEIARTLSELRIRHEHWPHGAIVDHVATLLARGEVVGWFQGRLEFGPRTLGNRCVLANPATPSSGREISERLKHTESWFRFTPAVTERNAREVFEEGNPAPFARVTRTCRPKWRASLGQAVQSDGTCKPLVVSEASNPRFHALLEAFEIRTGVPALLCTSLSRPREPLACSPADALATFFGSGLGFLALGDRLVSKAFDTAPEVSSEARTEDSKP
ncbi:MAG: carbamoyltransferase C-terminal domain-containing protein [Planctomycetota bacterium]